MTAAWHPAVLFGTAAAVTGSVLGTCTRPAAGSAATSSADERRCEATPAAGAIRRIAGPRRVLVTGCNGSIGRPVCAWLKSAGHFVRGFDVVRHPCTADSCNEFVDGDICDTEAVEKAMVGVDVLIHLAAFPDIKDADGNAVGFIDTLMMPNVAGLYVCVEAALQAGVARVVLASSVQVITGFTSSADVDARPKPNLPAVGGTDLFFAESDGVAPLHEYALTKVWAEQLGELIGSEAYSVDTVPTICESEFYARVHGLSIVNARIGWFVRNESEAAAMWQAESGDLDGLNAGSGFSVYLSHDDAGRFYQACVESAPTKGECITTFVTSKQPTARLDIEPARHLLGFEPEDTFPAGLPFDSTPT